MTGNGAAGLILYHAGFSSCSQRVRLLLAETGLPWESREVDLAGRANLQPAHLAIHPHGLVPALVDGDRIVRGSAVILRHLWALSERPPPGPSSDSLLRAADQAQPLLKTLTHEYLFLGRGRPSAPDAERFEHPAPGATAFARLFARGGPAWEQRVADDAGHMHAALDRLEVRLVGPWIEGGEPGLADFAWIPSLHRLALLGWPLDRWPRLSELYRRWRARPSFGVAISSAEPLAVRTAAATYAARRAAEGTGLAARLAGMRT